MSDKLEESKMENVSSIDTSSQGKFKPLRTWPAVLLIVGMLALVIIRFLPFLADDESMILMLVTIMGPMAIGALIMLWWVTFSRATMIERLVGLFGVILVAVIATFLCHPSMMGPGIMIISIPMGTAAFAISAILLRNHLSIKRTLIAILIAGFGFGFTALLRSDGMWANADLECYWRWQPSAEEQMLAERDSQETLSLTELSSSDVDAWLAKPEWPRFRGSDGLGAYEGRRISTDWSVEKPELLWKIPVGPGWSSFAVAGNLLFTQEQHGENEAIVCYAADSGKEVWSQQVEARFSDPMGGPGPRATPTISNGALFVQGAIGQLQRLNPKTGDVVWSVDIRKVSDREPPMWGFSSSPLVVGSVVIVHAGGADDKGTLAFDVENGELKWSSSAGDHSYSSPQLGSIGGEQSVLMLTNKGINVLDPATGNQLLDYEWPHSGYRVLQPQVVDGDSILIPTQSLGTRRIRVSKSGDKFEAEEVWTSNHLQPDFNDFVIYENHAYGFSGNIFTCVDLETGKRKWKGGRYGKGQVLLLATSGTLLVTSESGDVVLVKADPSGHQELAKFQALDGKTWNHPVVIGDRLYVRNSKEAASYRLPCETDLGGDQGQ